MSTLADIRCHSCGAALDLDLEPHEAEVLARSVGPLFCSEACAAGEPKTRTVECFSCQGRGFVRFVDRFARTERGVRKKCGRCGGTGQREVTA